MTTTAIIPPAPLSSNDATPQRGRRSRIGAEHASHQLVVRLTPSLRKHLETQANQCDITMAEVARKLLAEEPIRQREVVKIAPRIDAAVLRELQAQGNNLNQIAKQLNESKGGFIGSLVGGGKAKINDDLAALITMNRATIDAINKLIG